MISEDTHKLLSPRVQKLCRRLDRVTVKGSEQPMSLYTYDLPPSSAKTLSELALPPGVDFWDRFPPSTSHEYRAIYAIAVESYLDGHWDEARQQLLCCKNMVPEDAAADVLMTVMRKNAQTLKSTL